MAEHHPTVQHHAPHSHPQSHHESHHGESPNFKELNKNHFNEHAHQYNDHPDALELARRLGAAMIGAYPFDKDSTLVLDYACGTGLISKELASHAKCIVGVDISQGMVDQYNQSVENQGIPPEEMRAVCCDLTAVPDQLDGMIFDVVVCAAAYHHFPSIEEVTKALASYLKPEGSLLVADFMKSSSSQEFKFPDDVRHIVPHKGGFEEADIKAVFEGAGLTNFTFVTATMENLKKHGLPDQFFLASGTKEVNEQV